MYRIVFEIERENRKSQIINKIGTTVFGVKNLLKENNQYLNLGIDWIGNEEDSRRVANQFIRG